MTGSIEVGQLPRIKDFRSDLTPGQIAAAEAANTRAISMPASALNLVHRIGGCTQ